MHPTFTITRTRTLTALIGGALAALLAWYLPQVARANECRYLLSDAAKDTCFAQAAATPVSWVPVLAAFVVVNVMVGLYCLIDHDV